MILALLGVGVFATYLKNTPPAVHVRQDVPSRLDRSGGPDLNVDVVPTYRRSSNTGEYKLPAPKGTDVALDGPAPAVPEGMDPHVFIATETFHAMGVKDGRALGIELKDGAATIDINDGVLGHGYGSMEEGQLIKALQLSLGQFSDVSTFQMRNSGQIVDSLGHLELSDPIKVIRPGAETHSEG
jgi:hypothetical protein